MKKVFIALFSLLILFSCSEKKTHFITDKKYRTEVHKQFVKTKKLAQNRSAELFSIFDKNLTTEQVEALEFLFAYMPLSDLADYNGDFFLNQVNTAFEARETFSWGKNIPEDIFRHFVLVYRVNNENLDTARSLFFHELKDRIKNMSMYDAALEVNHWCHEKVCYKPSDGRTSAPLATLCTSWGRCGEESTFTVTALRAVGIPARQCYTPRWAHTDDNHAWVEVWIDGKWDYLGACEPEPELNIAWFTAPAKRAMMVHTNVFGNYTGKETVNFKNDLFTRINILSNYTSTKTICVKVVDKSGNAVENATVKYKLYNYSELYSLADQITDKSGFSSLVTGLGDLVIWTNKGNAFGYEKITVKTTDTITIKLNRVAGNEYEELMALIPPPAQKIEIPTGEKQTLNAQRLAHEDSIRNEYMSGFVTEKRTGELAKQLNLNKEETWKYLSLAQGNHKQIQQFIEKYATNKFLFPFLASLSEKDIRDSRFDVLDEHFSHAADLIAADSPKINDEILIKYVYSPRIHLELIRPWRTFLQTKLDKQLIAQIQQNPQAAANWIDKNITLDTERNYYKCPLSPKGTYELKQADIASRNILFVAICRSVGVPSRIDLATENPQYLQNSQWINAQFGEKETEKQETFLTLTNDKANIVKPEYYTHFTLAFFKDGDFTTLDYENSDVFKTFPTTLNLEPGYYRLMTGNRAETGTVFTKTIYFELKKSSKKEILITLVPIKLENQVIGNINLNTKTTLIDNRQKTLSELHSNKGLIIAFLDPQREPTRHVMNDIPILKKDFEKWGGGILFLIPDDKITNDFKVSNYKNLPKQSVFAIDAKREILQKALTSMNCTFNNDFPFLIFVTPKGEIIFSSEGYKIGISEDLMKVIDATNR